MITKYVECRTVMEIYVTSVFVHTPLLAISPPPAVRLEPKLYHSGLVAHLALVLTPVVGWVRVWLTKFFI